jgi:gliding motility-associated-like protein
VGDVVSFTNTSTNATSYFWEFGDAATSTAVHPSHSYAEPGVYKVCLTASNQGGCNDSICKNINVRDVPVIDVPTAFSPNGDNHNDVFYVRGHGVESFQCRIYNRWGELVHTITDLNVGWDGTYAGVPQEMEVYVYTLDATLIDGNIVAEKGNITLIR